jgi:S-adenosylmethionine hydrolase
MCQLTLHKYKILNSVTVITLLTDLGAASAELASLKGKISHLQGALSLVDIYHQAETQNYFAPAFLLRAYHRHFPEGCIHLVSVDVYAANLHLLGVCENRFFLAADNGILPMALDGEHVDYYRLNGSAHVRSIPRDLYIPAIASLLEHKMNPEAVATPFRHAVKLSWQQPYHLGEFVRITVLFNDEHGNAYTNLDRQWAETHMNGRSWKIKVGYNDYLDAPDLLPVRKQGGYPFAFWSENDFLVIGIQGASAASLLGFKRNYDIMIEFD